MRCVVTSTTPNVTCDYTLEVGVDEDGTYPLIITAYDAAGRMTTWTDPLARQTSYTYDSRSRISKITYPTGTLDVTTGMLTVAAGAGARVAGSHSGLKVETTNRAATQTVAVCAKISHRRCNMERTNLAHFPEN